MPRRTNEETSAAGAEAFRGGLVGAAKVREPLRVLHPRLPAAPLGRYS